MGRKRERKKANDAASKRKRDALKSKVKERERQAQMLAWQQSMVVSVSWRQCSGGFVGISNSTWRGGRPLQCDGICHRPPPPSFESS